MPESVLTPPRRLQVMDMVICQARGMCPVVVGAQNVRMILLNLQGIRQALESARFELL